MKTRGENQKESLRRDPEKDKLEYSRWKKIRRKFFYLSTSQSTAVGFSTVGDSGRPVGWSFFPTREQSSLSVNRGGRPDPTESKAFAVGRSHGRPKCTRRTLVHVGRPLGTDRANLLCLRSTGRLTDLRPKACYGNLFETSLFSTKQTLIFKYKIEF